MKRLRLSLETWPCHVTTKYFNFHREISCYSRNHKRILEQSQGGNSHQSETNLIDRPLKQPSLAPLTFLCPLSKVTFSFVMAVLDSGKKALYTRQAILEPTQNFETSSPVALFKLPACKSALDTLL
jgi:hypothetical protein